ncbi:EcsC family protein [Heyndrickxia sp. NPDC080065]|uniref:EcsC family protein n=1 Tax=Heyndrickxia sp. NPDC080065 TaxID=3390568 RepID=UPI003CFF106F
MTSEQQIKSEVEVWKRKLNKKSGIVNRITKRAQDKITGFIPEKAHQLITESIKKMIQATLFGSEYLTKPKVTQSLTMEEKEKLIMESLNKFRKTAAVEGAGTGAGGILLGLADFPLLLSIKMKFLFEAASIYGYDVKNYDERLFILYVFQLAFSSEEHKRAVLETIENWDQLKVELVDVDWRTLQQEYRDFIDFVKMLQLVPGIGAVVGAYANYNLLDQLGETAMNAYRIRWLNQNNTKIEDPT